MPQDLSRRWWAGGSRSCASPARRSKAGDPQPGSRRWKRELAQALSRLDRARSSGFAGSIGNAGITLTVLAVVYLALGTDMAFRWLLAAELMLVVRLRVGVRADAAFPDPNDHPRVVATEMEVD